MLLFATIAMFAATAAPLEIEDLEIAECESEEVVLYDDAEAESEVVLESQEIVLFDDEFESEAETLFEEN